MSVVVEIASTAALAVGAAFFVAGTIGVLRFETTLARVHAVTKADNLGLGLVAGGLAIGSGSATKALGFALVWLLALAASATSSHLIAREAAEEAEVPAPGDRG